MQFQAFGNARFTRPFNQAFGLIHGIRTHAAVGRPFAAGQGDQAAFADANDMIARQGFGFTTFRRFDQWTQSGKNTLYIFAFRRRIEVLRSGAQNEVNLFAQGARLQINIRHCGVGRADHHMFMPRHREQHTTVFGFRNHDRSITRQEFFIDNDVDALARREHGFGLRIFHTANVIDKHAGRIDHDRGARLDGFAGFAIAQRDTGDFSAVFEQANYRCIVHGYAAVLLKGAQQGDRQSAVIKLSVVVQNTAFQAFLLQGRRMAQGLVFAHVAAGFQV